MKKQNMKFGYRWSKERSRYVQTTTRTSSGRLTKAEKIATCAGKVILAIFIAGLLGLTLASWAYPTQAHFKIEADSPKQLYFGSWLRDQVNWGMEINLSTRSDGAQVELKNGTPEQNEVLNYAWEISQDEDFLCTILGENAQLTHDRKHNYEHSLCWTWDAWATKRPPNQKWCNAQPDENTFRRVHTDWAFGISDGYYRWIVEDERFFSDWKWNLEQTYKLWAGGTRFYGEAHCHVTRKLIVKK